MFYQPLEVVPYEILRHIGSFLEYDDRTRFNMLLTYEGRCRKRIPKLDIIGHDYFVRAKSIMNTLHLFDSVRGNQKRRAYLVWHLLVMLYKPMYRILLHYQTQTMFKHGLVFVDTVILKMNEFLYREPMHGVPKRRRRQIHRMAIKILTYVQSHGGPVEVLPKAQPLELK